MFSRGLKGRKQGHHTGKVKEREKRGGDVGNETELRRELKEARFTKLRIRGKELAIYSTRI